MKESESKEKLYICDHVDKCGSKDCLHSKPHSKHDACKEAYCPDKSYTVKCIPYKEEPRGSEYIHIADGLEEELPEPKTKRFAVIWVGEVPVDKCENPVICDEMTGYLYDQVELIDGDRVRDWWSGPIGGDRTRYIAIDPPKPTPEPETVQEVIEAPPIILDSSEIKTVTDAKDYLNSLQEFGERLIKAAQEREGSQ